jgi:acylphosphatase
MSNTELASLHAIVYGYVQGVFFRAFVSRRANELGLTGYVRNLPNGEAVEVQAEGERNQLEKLISHLRVGPPAAIVERVVTNWSEYTGNYSEFSIKYSWD